MTVSTSYSPIVSPGNGTAAAISVTWPFFASSDLLVTHISATGVETVKALTTDYTVTGGADADGLPATGTITPVATRASGTSWRIERVTPKTQATTWDAYEKFPEKSVEAAIDRLTLIAQEGGSPGSVNDGISGDVLQLDSSGATDYWDAESHVIRNVADAEESTDAVNYGQLQQVIIDAGAGDVVGPASAVDSIIAVFDGTSGNLIKQGSKSIATIDSAITAANAATAVVAADLAALEASLTADRLLITSTGTVTGDGVTDDSAAIQAFIDAHKGATIYFPPGTYLAAGILLSGSTYDGTKLIFEPGAELKLAVRATTTTYNFQSACWAGLILHDADNCEVVFRCNGDRSNQPAEEHIYCMVVAGCTNTRIPLLDVREIRGDGLYIGQKTLTSNSTNTDGIWIGTAIGYNTASDGRNLISVVSGDNGTIGMLKSFNVGGTIGSTLEPGGLDFEPDQTYQTCKNWAIGTVEVVGAFATGLAIQGCTSDATVFATQNITVANYSCINTGAATIADAIGNTTITAGHCLQIAYGVRNVNVRGVCRYTAAYGDAVIIGDGENITVDMACYHVRQGARIGGDTGMTTGPINSRINILAEDVCRWGVQLTLATSTRVTGSIRVPTTGYYTTLGAVYWVNTVLSDVHVSVDVPYDAGWTRSHRAEGTSSLTNCSVRDCAITGSWGSELAQAGDNQIMRYNVEGLNQRSAAPTGGAWKAGTRITTTAPTVGQPKGWLCTVSGTPGTWVSEGNL